MQQELRNKLYNYEAAPPEDAWTNIAQELDKFSAEPAPVKISEPASSPAPARVYHIRKWAAAAAVLIIVGGLAYWFNSPPASDNSTVVNKDTTPKPIDNSDKTEYIAGTEPEKEKEKTSYATVTRTHKEYHPEPDVVTHDLAIRPSNVDRPITLTAGYNYSGISDAVQYAANLDQTKNLVPADSYVVYKNNKGELIRMSPKLAAFVGEDPEIRIVPGVGIVGSNRLKWILSQWEEKINRSSFIPSPENFMDIIALIEMMEGQEKKK